MILAKKTFNGPGKDTIKLKVLVSVGDNDLNLTNYVSLHSIVTHTMLHEILLIAISSMHSSIKLQKYILNAYQLIFWMIIMRGLLYS
ncbi:hypothetical protein D0T08_02555 [Emticicia sp. C21]|nr:hypothetical protein D0T08_02555 [Emticicia sp. C21]